MVVYYWGLWCGGLEGGGDGDGLRCGGGEVGGGVGWFRFTGCVVVWVVGGEYCRCVKSAVLFVEWTVWVGWCFWLVDGLVCGWGFVVVVSVCIYKRKKHAGFFDRVFFLYFGCFFSRHCVLPYALNLCS